MMMARDSISADFSNLRARWKCTKVIGALLVTFLVTAVSSAAQARSSLDLYQRLAGVNLDPQQVYQVRDASIDREDVHISLNDGTLAFAQAIDGRITGLFFVGDGEILVVPPDQAERSSLSLFTGSAVLNEKLNAVFLRFFDDSIISDLKPALRPPENPADFIGSYSRIAHELGARDALRLLSAFTAAPEVAARQHYLRARISGDHLGSFDVLLDSEAREQVAIGQASATGAAIYYDLWMSFPMRSARSSGRVWNDPVRVTQQTIAITVQPPSDIAAEATTFVSIGDSGQRTIVMELSRFLKVSKVEELNADGIATSLEFIQNPALEGTQLARRGNDAVAIVFPQPLRAGEQLRLRFTYSGPVMEDAGGGLMYVGARGIWYPNRGLQMADYHLTFRYPSEWKLLATGKLEDQKADGAYTVGRWHSERPIPVAGFNLGKYEAGSANAGSVLVQSYAGSGMENAFRTGTVVLSTPQYPFRRHGIAPALPPATAALPKPDPRRNAQSVAARAAETIQFLQPRIGAFPYSLLSITQMPGHSSQGWPGLLFLSSYVFVSPEERAALMPAQAADPMQRLMYEKVMLAHETAHQWWGDALYWSTYRDQWWMEALANYSALMEVESKDPQAAREILDGYRRALMEKTPGGENWQAGPVSLGIRLESSKFPEGYESVAYGRGTWLIHMLRQMLRDTAPKTSPDPDAVFWGVLRKLQTDFRGKTFTSRDIQDAFEAVLPPSLDFEGKRSLDWFFEGWVNGTAVPAFELQDVRFTTHAGKRIATATLLQKHAPKEMATSIPVYALVSGSNTPHFVARVFADGDATALKLTVPEATRKLLVDPYGTVLTRPQE